MGKSGHKGKNKDRDKVKTNAMRFLDTHNAEYSVLTYECDEFHDGVTIARTLNIPEEQTFKTLVTVGKSGEHYVFVVPVAGELDLKKCASAVGEKSVEMINVNTITDVTGYIRGGCSPIGMKKSFRTVIDDSAQNHEKIFFSGGKRGVQICMSPTLLADLINADFASIQFREYF